MQPIPFLSKSLGESAWTTRLRNHDGNIYRLVNAFNCRLNVAGLNPLGYNFNQFLGALMKSHVDCWKATPVSWCNKNNNNNKFFRGNQVFKAAWKFFPRNPSTKIYPTIFKVCFFRSQYISENPSNPSNSRHPVLVKEYYLWFINNFYQGQLFSLTSYKAKNYRLLLPS